ncbi:MAG: radical SAM protein [Alphaproteobacteria bacterium]|nr:radical SAM protein [Alphaproteobacteria bacterium]
MTMYSALRHIPSIFRKHRPIQLTFFVTRKCNARCPWCFYLNSRDAAVDGELLSLIEIRKVSGSLGRLLWVAFSGGEVFLRKDLLDVSAIFHDRNRPRIMLFPTNGLLPEAITDRTECILRRCPNSVIVVKVSLDGLNGAHDELRQSPGAFEKAMETYRSLGRLRARYPNLELGINTVFLSENQDRMDEIIDFVAASDTKGTHTVSMIRGNLVEERYKSVDAGKYRRAADRLERNLKDGVSSIHSFAGSRFKAAQDILQRRLIHGTLLADRRQVPCYAGTLNLVLTETGEIHPCEVLGNSLGNVRAHGYDVARLLKSDRARGILGPIVDGACHCTHECNFIMNILFNPRLYPALFKEYLGLGGVRPGAAAAPVASAGTASCPSTAKTDSAGR